MLSMTVRPSLRPWRRRMTPIEDTCAVYPKIEALDVCLRERPVLSGSGRLSVRLMVDAEGMASLRRA